MDCTMAKLAVSRASMVMAMRPSNRVTASSATHVDRPSNANCPSHTEGASSQPSPLCADECPVVNQDATGISVSSPHLLTHDARHEQVYVPVRAR